MQQFFVLKQESKIACQHGLCILGLLWAVCVLMLKCTVHCSLLAAKKMPSECDLALLVDTMKHDA